MLGCCLLVCLDSDWHRLRYHSVQKLCTLHMDTKRQRLTLKLTDAEFGLNTWLWKRTNIAHCRQCIWPHNPCNTQSNIMQRQTQICVGVKGETNAKPDFSTSEYLLLALCTFGLWGFHFKCNTCSSGFSGQRADNAAIFLLHGRSLSLYANQQVIFNWSIIKHTLRLTVG